MGSQRLFTTKKERPRELVRVRGFSYMSLFLFVYLFMCKPLWLS